MAYVVGDGGLFEAATLPLAASKASKVATVNKLNKATDITSDIAKGSSFIPKKVILSNGEVAYLSKFNEYVRSPEFLKPNGEIDWPDAKGFVIDKHGQPIKVDANLKQGQIIDRFGEPNGTFTSPVDINNPIKYDERGLPYPESEMTYHKYEIIQDINLKNVQVAFENLSKTDKKTLNKSMKKYDFSLKDLANPQSGKISEVFGSGGGTQIELGTTIEWYEKSGLITEVI